MKTKDRVRTVQDRNMQGILILTHRVALIKKYPMLWPVNQLSIPTQTWKHKAKH